jgi:hypothetical protein
MAEVRRRRLVMMRCIDDFPFSSISFPFPFFNLLEIFFYINRFMKTRIPRGSHELGDP